MAARSRAEAAGMKRPRDGTARPGQSAGGEEGLLEQEGEQGDLSIQLRC